MAVGVDGRWTAGIGDPSPVGWITVACYGVAALAACRNALAARRTAVPFGFWVVVGALMLLLGVNKQLDLQTWFGQTGRDLALAQGWYAHRRVVQGVFIVALASLALTVLWGLRRRWAGLWNEYRWVFVGLGLLALFIVIRALSFHHADELIGIDMGATTLGRALELVGVVAIVVACARWHAMHRRRVRRFAVERAVRPVVRRV
jgi:hypothetical protein